ncbi:Methylenetetrahydrofolate reductase [Nymphon striatum]|nr:Methylenetetrahydrofolate reductase [Nymphon striatum]
MYTSSTVSQRVDKKVESMEIYSKVNSLNDEEFCSSSSSNASPINSRPASPDLTRSYVSLTDKIRSRMMSGNKFFSLEFFPPRTKAGAVNLLSRLDRMGLGGPLFCDITWHSSGNPGGDQETSSMAIASAALNFCGLETMLHFTCCDMSVDQVQTHLDRAKCLGIRNILALRGDIPDGCEKTSKNDFRYAVDLVRFIKEVYGDYFIICVAGYPSGHPDAISYHEDLMYLKSKVVAGADFIITQLFFDSKKFCNFVKDCRNMEINVPYYSRSYAHSIGTLLRNIVKLSKLEVPKHIVDTLTPIQGNDQAVQNFGIDYAVKMCHEILSSDYAPGIHFYTLNREVAACVILKQLGLWHKSPSKPLPWGNSTNHHKRCTEDVRPIFWSSRQKSYIYRTMSWDEFPNGRWGNSASPAFGELKDYYLFVLKNRSPKKELLDMWGHELTSEQDIWNIFYCYLTGKINKHGTLVCKMPWNEEELSPETSLICEKLANFNSKGVLTINSQPNINGWPSTDEVVGWGVPGGYVYQKAYLEFFTSKENVVALKEVLREYSRVNYHIINKSGIMDYTNCLKHKPVAVTWGVFPGREIVQPTVVDSDSFKVWKSNLSQIKYLKNEGDEAFALWTEQWGKLYPEESPSRKLIKHVTESYYLVNLVDNNYPEDSCLWNVLDAMFEKRKQLFQY